MNFSPVTAFFFIFAGIVLILLLTGHMQPALNAMQGKGKYYAQPKKKKVK